MNLGTRNCISEAELDPLALCFLDPAGALQLTDEFRRDLGTQQSGLGEPWRWHLHQSHAGFQLRMTWDWGTYHPSRAWRLTHVPAAWKHLVTYFSTEEREKCLQQGGDLANYRIT